MKNTIVLIEVAALKLIDNINNIVRDDLRETIKAGSKVSIAAAYFSIYAYAALKEELEAIDEFCFIFTSQPSQNYCLLSWTQSLVFSL